jgi:diadenosine tetraphosphate (Ap4A) HIT family hydrolase
MASDECPFCTLPPDRIVAQSALALAVRDAFPASPGHTLIVPRRHVRSFFEVTAEERAEMLALLDAVKAQIDAAHRPDGYNLGINDGAAAGQTVAHLHMHLIPRYRGDVADPRGGVRWVLAERARYWGPDD